MRQADINRVNKAKQHLQAAVTILQNIKWENINSKENYLLGQVGEYIAGANTYLENIINIQGK